MSKKSKKNVEQGDVKTLIRNLKKQSEELTAEQMVCDKPSRCPAEIKEKFWEYVAAFEQATWNQPFQVLIESGISLPSPDELDDSQLTAKLWEVVNALSLLRVYLQHTDHLSDRELYDQLWNDLLREEMVLQPDNADFASGGGDRAAGHATHHWADDGATICAGGVAGHSGGVAAAGVSVRAASGEGRRPGEARCAAVQRAVSVVHLCRRSGGCEPCCTAQD